MNKEGEAYRGQRVPLETQSHLPREEEAAAYAAA